MTGSTPGPGHRGRTGAAPVRVRGTDAATGEELDLWVRDGVFVDPPDRDGADRGGEVVELSGWVLPGLVDAHCHIGYSTAGAATLPEAEDQARTELAAGVLAIRDCGSPIDTRPLVGRPDLPVLIRAGRHIARPRRYIRELGVDVEPDQLVDEVRRQLAYGDGWIKIVGDWIDRAVGDLSPLWPQDVLAQAIAVAHAGGARVTTHVFGEDGLDRMLAAGVDCVEHGTGMTDDSIVVLAARGVRVVPTLINIANFPSFADAAGRYPTYARHMRDLYARSRDTYRRAADAGVVLHAGTDAGGYVEHGRIVDEVQALAELGIPPRQVLRQAAHDARAWLGLGSYRPGDPADLLVLDTDPARDRAALAGLRAPAAVLRSGVVRAGRHLPPVAAG
ncbi:amidohydrolase family protein [Nakamurella endophytica]|uniref:Amidohydrolase n=1 Tax=Nakamurella endophytica TaxID=1748367 RepID=A0A917SPT8_9ACTN|nr:amidohydrolase family protein [Nakamurella endophytica]GGL90382.1 amidohydrolase [Nakamurella endophytica]